MVLTLSTKKAREKRCPFSKEIRVRAVATQSSLPDRATPRRVGSPVPPPAAGDSQVASCVWVGPTFQQESCCTFLVQWRLASSRVFSPANTYTCWGNSFQSSPWNRDSYLCLMEGTFHPNGRRTAGDARLTLVSSTPLIWMILVKISHAHSTLKIEPIIQCNISMSLIKIYPWVHILQHLKERQILCVILFILVLNSCSC